MTSFGPELVEHVKAACTAGAAEAAQACGRSLDAPFQLAVSSAGLLDVAAWSDAIPAGPGLVLGLLLEGGAAAVVIPEAGGLLPDWYRQPDPTGRSKLLTLAQEWGMLLLPEEFMPMDFLAGAVPNLRTALTQAGAVSGAGMVMLTLVSGERSCPAALVWPIGAPQSLLAPAVETPLPAPAPPTASPAVPAPVPPGVSKPPNPPVSKPPTRRSPAGCPPYTQSLLRIRVPVAVTLAKQRQPVTRILELGLGTLIQFDKLCTEPLQLEVGGQTIATGEAVKVGEKFGLRISQIVLPEERFTPVRAPTGERGA